MTVDAIGHQWYWEFRYPGTQAVTANEIHIPVDTRINLVATTADVIHSFWVPQLNRKIDTIPGQAERDRAATPTRPASTAASAPSSAASSTRTWRCYVFAEPKPQFQALAAGAGRSRPGRRPATLERRGQQVFLDRRARAATRSAARRARGYVGPDLTHLASRRRSAARRSRTRRATSPAGSSTPQHFKPGNQMPDLQPRAARSSERSSPTWRACDSRRLSSSAGSRQERSSGSSACGSRARRARLADDDRPQADRPPLLLDDARLLRRRRRRGARHAHAARPAEPTRRSARAPTTSCSRCTGSR